MTPVRAALAANRYLVAGLIGGLATPLAVLGLGVPLLVGVAASVLTFTGLILALTPTRLSSELGPEALVSGQATLVRQLLADAEQELRALRQAGDAVADPGLRARVLALETTGRRVAATLASEPEHVGRVQRLLTFHLPVARRVAEGCVALERMSRPDPDRVARVEKALDHLGRVYAGYADRLVVDDLRALDVELRLLDREGQGLGPA